MRKNFILVSGGAGYLGQNLIKQLIKLNKNVISIDIKEFPFKHHHLKKITLNMTNYNHLHTKLKNLNISFIFHFAAISNIEYSVLNPKKTLNNNIFSTYNLLKIGNEKKIKKFIFASSIYTNSTQGSFYRISKICCEEIIEEYQRLFGLKYIIVRYGSLFGDLNFTNTINNIISLGLKGKTIIREGSGREIRNYISIDDAVSLTIKLLEEKYNKSYYNIIGNEKINFKKIIKIIKEHIPNLKIKYTNKIYNHHYIKSPYNKRKRLFYNLTINKKNYFKNNIKNYIDFSDKYK